MENRDKERRENMYSPAALDEMLQLGEKVDSCLSKGNYMAAMLVADNLGDSYNKGALYAGIAAHIAGQMDKLKGKEGYNGENQPAMLKQLMSYCTEKAGYFK